MNRRVLLLPAVLAAMALTACTDSGTKTEAAPQSAVQTAYLAYWQAALAANESPAAEHDLAAVATGQQLRADEALIQQRQQTGEQVTGTYEHSPSVTKVDGSTATVQDCMTADLTVSGPQGDQQVPAGPYAVTASLVKADDTWLVAQLTTGQQCTAASSSAEAGK
jgi:hypothetical protein